MREHMMVIDKIQNVRNDDPEPFKVAINQLLEQLEKRNQRLSLLRSENEQLTQQLAKSEQSLRISENLAKEFGERRARVDDLETTLREHQAQIQHRDEQIKDLQAQIEELKLLSTRLADKELKFSAELAERDLVWQRLAIDLEEKDRNLQAISAKLAQQDRALQLVTNGEKERVDVLSAQLLDTENQLNRITGSLGWRLLSRFGRIKYGFLSPIYRRFTFRRKHT
jgi:chromosome segregation ATPase